MPPGLPIKLFAAITFGVAATFFLLVVWNLIQKQRQSGRSGSNLTSMRRAEMRERALRENSLFRWALPFISGLAASVNKLGMDPIRQYIHDPYVRAGYPGGMDDDEVVALGALLSITFTVILAFITAALFGIGFVWISLIGLLLGFFTLVAHLRSLAAERQREIQRALPYVLDLLVLMLRSGTSLRIALARVIDDYARHPIGIEFGQVLAEIDVGSQRADAFKKMADRLKISDITLLVDAIVQSEELGWPLADTLERLADRINTERVLTAQATAGAAGVYVMLPSTLVLLAAVLLLFSPFIISYLVNGTLD